MLPNLIWFIGFSSFGGASMPLAIFSDLLSALTIHIYSFYLASARIFNWQLSILVSLFHLFRGKKHNVLRDRIDSCDYDLDQLLVGTIVFTLLVFLLPTVLVFYINFAFARMIIIMLKAGFDTLLSCLNHFPLFAIMLRIKDPARLPGRSTLERIRLNSRANSFRRRPIRARKESIVGQLTSSAPNIYHPPQGISLNPLLILRPPAYHLPANSSFIRRHVPPVPPDGTSHPQALPLADGALLPRDGQAGAAYRPEEPLQPTVQHAPGAEAGDLGDVGGFDRGRATEEAGVDGGRGAEGAWEEGQVVIYNEMIWIVRLYLTFCMRCAVRTRLNLTGEFTWLWAKISSIKRHSQWAPPPSATRKSPTKLQPTLIALPLTPNLQDNRRV